jgi:hypothetical protein
MAFADNKPRIISSAFGHVQVLLGEAVYAGDLLGFDGTDWVQADALATAPVAARLVALEDGANDETISAAPFAVISSYTGATKNSPLFLSSTDGAVAETVTGSLYQKVGVVVSATEGILCPMYAEELGVMVVARSTTDTRAGYFRLYQATAAGSGDAARAYHTVLAGVAAASAHGLHSSVSFNAGASVTVLACGLRATLDFAANTASPAGTYCALQVDSNVGTGITLPATNSFIRVADNGAVKLTHLFELPAPANGTIFAAHITEVMSHSLKVVDRDGTAYYIMLTDAATHRS